MNIDSKLAVAVSGYVCHALDQQVFPIEPLWIMAKRAFPEIERCDFDEILDILDNHAAITGISNGYIYETTSLGHKRLTHKEIMALIKPWFFQCHSQKLILL